MKTLKKLTVMIFLLVNGASHAMETVSIKLLGGTNKLNARLWIENEKFRTNVSYIDYTINDDKSAFIDEVHTYLGFRCRGYASALLRHVCSDLRDLGYMQVTLDVTWGNFVAQSLYEKCGFSFKDDQGEINSDMDTRCYKMTKKLTKPEADV